MAQQINFYIGKREKYNVDNHIGFYVSSDTDELLYNGKSLGDIISSYQFDTNGKLTLTMKSGKTVEISFPETTSTQSGLLSAADKAKIDGIDAAITDAVGAIEEELESLKTEVSDIILKCIVSEKTTAAEAAAELAELGIGYRTLAEVANTLKSFLNDSDTVDTTINKWKEIEAFLAGITDNNTLTGLLKDVSDKVDAEKTRAEGKEGELLTKITNIESEMNKIYIIEVE